MTAAPAPSLAPGIDIGSHDQPAAVIDPQGLREFAALAALFCETPFASMVVAEQRTSWGRSPSQADAPEVPEHRIFDEYVLLGADLFEVEDARTDKRFDGTGTPVNAPAPISYVGVPLLGADGSAIGTLAVMDLVPRRLSQTQRASLTALAAQASVRIALSEELRLSRATANENLRQIETLHQDTFEQAPIGIAYADREGRFLRVNRAFAQTVGFVPAELEGMSIAELTHAADFGHNAAEIARLWRGEIASYSLEKRYRSKDGSPIWVRVTAALVRNANGAPECSVGFLEAISERKQMEQQRRDSELELERIHKELLDASRLAGMAEVASNVLHNVGNVLTSVNVSASLVAECVKDAKVAGLGRAAALLKEREQDLAAFLTSDERGRRLPGYLAQLAEHLQGNQRLALKELGALRDNIDHIKETVAMQQSYAKLCGVSETVALADLIEDSLRMNAAALSRHGVGVRCEIPDQIPSINADKHKILQILVNLIRNAKYACDESGRADKLVVVRAQSDERTVSISVIDNGVGIHPDNMGRLFRHGFTTRKTGHGFGLHSGALAAKELGGSLTAHSDGPGSGASFILTLPRGEPNGT